MVVWSEISPWALELIVEKRDFFHVAKVEESQGEQHLDSRSKPQRGAGESPLRWWG